MESARSHLCVSSIQVIRGSLSASTPYWISLANEAAYKVLLLSTESMRTAYYNEDEEFHQSGALIVIPMS
jgi:hypothetical protein